MYAHWRSAGGVGSPQNQNVSGIGLDLLQVCDDGVVHESLCSQVAGTSVTEEVSIHTTRSTVLFLDTILPSELQERIFI